jgi:coatomer protein complex subunit gamma
MGVGKHFVYEQPSTWTHIDQNDVSAKHGVGKQSFHVAGN